MADIIGDEANADIGVIDTDIHRTPYVTPWNSDENPQSSNRSTCSSSSSRNGTETT